jgi:YHYH protein
MMSSVLLLVFALSSPSGGSEVIANGDFSQVSNGGKPVAYKLQGAVHFGKVGYTDEITGKGVWLDSRSASGSVSQMVRLAPSAGRWITFRIRGRAEDGFNLKNEQFFMKLDFFSHQGKSYQDTAKRLIWREIKRDRKDFTVNGNYGKYGAMVWRTYEFEERLPFAETDSVQVTLAFTGGKGTDPKYSRFFATDFSLKQSNHSSNGKVEPVATTKNPLSSPTAKLFPLGGRWFYLPRQGEKVSKHIVVNARNASQLWYHDDLWTTPFDGNMDAILRAGYLDRNGKIVPKDRYIADNLWVEFDGSGYWTIHSKNIPNHPTAKFPDTYGTQGYNPNYIMEQDNVYKLPLNPKRIQNAMSLPKSGKDNGALHMGSIGFATNGVVFYNPYDAGAQDATSIMDRCCGHPSPDYRYHYHKYPICVNTPFVDKGNAHSPLIGFAFDGFPVYGPYERGGLMARDLKKNPLDSFNAHYDPSHGWHYHVTPGRFPYIIGGFMGLESSNVEWR